MFYEEWIFPSTNTLHMPIECHPFFATHIHMCLHWSAWTVIQRRACFTLAQYIHMRFQTAQTHTFYLLFMYCGCYSSLAFIPSHFPLSLSVCGLFFNSNTFSMVSGCIHRSLLQCVGHILQPKVSLRCNPSFRFGHFQMTTLVFYIVHFHTLKGEHDVVSVWQPSMNDAKGSESVIVCLWVAFCDRVHYADDD